MKHIKSTITMVIFILCLLFIGCTSSRSFQGDISDGVIEIPTPTQRGIKEGKPIGVSIAVCPFAMADNIKTVPLHFASLFTQTLSDYLTKAKVFESVRISDVETSQKDIVLTGTITELKVMVTAISVYPMVDVKYDDAATFSIQITLQNKEGQKISFDVTKTHGFSNLKRWGEKALANVVADALEEIITRLREKEKEVVALRKAEILSMSFEEWLQNDPKALKIQKLYTEGLITQDEYRQMLQEAFGKPIDPSEFK